MKKSINYLVSIFVFLLLLAISNRAEAKVKLERIDAKDRYEFSVISSKFVYRSSKIACLVNGKSEADMALTPYLSLKIGGPVFLTDGEVLDKEIKLELQRLGVKLIYFVGGEKSISKEIEEELSKSFKVSRLGGMDRYQTSLNVCKAFYNPKEESLLVADGTNVKNQLFSATISRIEKSPIIYINRRLELKETVDFLDDEGKIVKTILNIKDNFKSWKHKPDKYDYIDINHKDYVEFSSNIRSHLDFDSRHAILINGESFSDVICGLNIVDNLEEKQLLVNGDPLYFIYKKKIPDIIKEELEGNYLNTIYLFCGKITIALDNFNLKSKHTRFVDELPSNLNKDCDKLRISVDNNRQLLLLKDPSIIKKAFNFPSIRLIKSKDIIVNRKSTGNVRLLWDFYIEYPTNNKDEFVWLGVDYARGYMQLTSNKRGIDYITYKIHPDDVSKLKEYTNFLKLNAIK